MGQKVNPNIFQLGINKEWNAKFSEITNEEHTLYNYQNIEIKNFIKKFFKDFGSDVHLIKLGYTQKYLYVFISYYFTDKFINICQKKRVNNKKIKRKKIKTPPFEITKFLDNNLVIYKNKIIQNKKLIKKLNKNLTIIRLLKHHLKLRKESTKFDYFSKLLKFSKQEINKKQKKIIFLFSKLVRKEKNLCLYSKLKEIFNEKFNFYDKNLKIKNIFLDQLLKTLTFFTNNKFHVKIILQHVNKGITMKFNRRNRFKLRKKLILLRQYSRQDFFKAGVSTIITFLTVNNSANILAEYIFKYIKKLKRHNYFFVFLKRALNHIIALDFCKVKGIKINIKGRFNGRPRSRMKSIIAGDIAVQSFNKRIEYLQKTVYTKDGTFGIKIWVNT